MEPPFRARSNMIMIIKRTHRTDASFVVTGVFSGQLSSVHGFHENRPRRTEIRQPSWCLSLWPLVEACGDRDKLAEAWDDTECPRLVLGELGASRFKISSSPRLISPRNFASSSSVGAAARSIFRSSRPIWPSFSINGDGSGSGFCGTLSRSDSTAQPHNRTVIA